MAENDGLATSGIQISATEALMTKAPLTKGLATPMRGFRFTASFSGLGTTSFKSISGFSSTVDSSEYREGGFGYLTKRKLPGLVSYDDIVLEKGLYSNLTLYRFFNSYLEGNNFNPVDAVITLYDNAGNATASWSVINAWPTSYKSGDLNAEDSGILIESLTLVHEGIKRDETVVVAK